MGRWSRIEAFLDKEVERETRKILAKAKAAMGLGKANSGNGHTKPVEAKVKRKAKASPARVLHGRYLGLIRNLTATQKKMVKEIREGKGVKLAIAAAKKMRETAKAEA